MIIPRTRKRLTFRNTILAATGSAVFITVLAMLLWFALPKFSEDRSLRYVTTLAGLNGQIGEPFGVAVDGEDIFVTDGQNGKIWKLTRGNLSVFAENLDTPSGIAITKNGDILVADSGSHTVLTFDRTGKPGTIYGVKNSRGSDDGDAQTARFNAPVGVAVALSGRVFVADTYNDRIRVIENGKVSTLAGGERGFADGPAALAKFDTPTGLSAGGDRLYITDTGNRRIRVVESDGRVLTVAGNGEGGLVDGMLLSASFVQPVAIAVDDLGTVFVADGNAIRSMTGAVPYVSTLSDKERGLADGVRSQARFNRPSGIAISVSGELIVADSENRLVRKMGNKADGYRVSEEEIARLRDQPEDFRRAAPARWPYDPPAAKRDIAGTLGEIRGEMTPAADEVWFHNGLDIAGAYGETARFIRDEKVLRPVAAENFGTLRELIRMPTLGYIHIRLGRNADGKPFGDERFQFQLDASGKLDDVRVPRGTKFRAGEAIGTLNPMNHVHLIAGRSGSEMNALDALILPGISDARPPVIEKVTFYDQNWDPVETSVAGPRIKLSGNIRIVVKAYDQMDGNAERRRLGVYKLGYSLTRKGEPEAEVTWTIRFDKMPSNNAVKFAYAEKSHSGATGETIFNYIVTNYVGEDGAREGFLSAVPGLYTLRVVAADYFGNVSRKEFEIEVI